MMKLLSFNSLSFKVEIYGNKLGNIFQFQPFYGKVGLMFKKLCLKLGLRKADWVGDGAR